MQRAARYVHGGNHRLKGGRNIELVGGRVVKRCSARSSLACMAAVTERESFTSTKRVENRGEGGGLPQSRRAPLYRRPRPVRDTTLRHSLARLLSSSYSPFFSLLRIFILLGAFFSSFFFSTMGKLLPAFISPSASPPTLSILLLEPRPLVWPRRCFRPLPLIIHFLTRDPRDRPRVAELFIHFFVLLYSSSFLSASSFESFFLSRKKNIYISRV